MLGFFAAAFTGCATKKIDWTARVGHYTFDQAVLEFGPPDKQAKLQDGTLVAEWLTYRGRHQTFIAPGSYGCCGPYYSTAYPTVIDTSTPDYFLRLIFDPAGGLKDWRRFAR